MKRKNIVIWMMAAFAVLNVSMYLLIKKFWIGGSSFLPMIGKFGPDNKFVFALLVNVGVIAGSFLSALLNKEFILRIPKKKQTGQAILGGTMIGMGVTITPGTCTTAFVTGVPMLSVSSFLSMAGIILGAYLMYNYLIKR